MESPAPGVLLIADPFLRDPNFLRTVVFLCDHQQEGSFGFVLNKKYNHTLEELINGADGLNIPVYYGGPVQVDTLHFLHYCPKEIPGGNEIKDGVYWGGNFETAIEQIKMGKVDKSKIRFFIGYSGWANGQLAEELKEKSWLTVMSSRKLIFHKKINEIWKDALRQLGGDYEMMINFPIDPQLN
ncbi:MAG: YqgE/AlgH family protein [Bacteroidetes bacterium]|nr:YqgE/AlgH family protein [Bacteroidota bacterium]MBS1975211.1 YqgE/AlgH family protein [Bacteroidota bacterium]